jgi:hypothetical protein
MRPLAGEQLAGQRQLLVERMPDLQRHQVRADDAREARAHLRLADLHAGMRHPQVAHQAHLEARAGGWCR